MSDAPFGFVPASRAVTFFPKGGVEVPNAYAGDLIVDQDGTPIGWWAGGGCIWSTPLGRNVVATDKHMTLRDMPDGPVKEAILRTVNFFMFPNGAI